jgi:hypothetical protein
MTITPFELSQDITVGIQFRLCTTDNPSRRRILICDFTGEFSGNRKNRENALYLSGFLGAGLEIAMAEGVVLNFSNLAYRYGDEMSFVVLKAIEKPCGCERAASIVASAANLMPLSTIWREVPSDYAKDLTLHLELENAIASVSEDLEGKKVLRKCTLHNSVELDIFEVPKCQ